MQTLDRTGRSPYNTGAGQVADTILHRAGSVRGEIVDGCVDCLQGFGRELRQSFPDNGDIEIVWLEAGLHASLPRLEEALGEAIDKAKPTERKVSLLYGQGCHPEISSFLEKHGVAAFPVKNCIEALLGKDAPEIKDTKTMIMTPGWVRAWPAMMDALR